MLGFLGGLQQVTEVMRRGPQLKHRALRPSARSCRVSHRVHKLLYLESIFKIGVKTLAVCQILQKIAKGRNKRVFIADDVTRLPEICGVWVPWPGHQQVASALKAGGIAGVEELQSVHVLQIESQAAFRSVDFKPIS